MTLLQVNEVKESKLSKFKESIRMFGKATKQTVVDSFKIQPLLPESPLVIEVFMEHFFDAFKDGVKVNGITAVWEVYEYENGDEEVSFSISIHDTMIYDSRFGWMISEDLNGETHELFHHVQASVTLPKYHDEVKYFVID